MASKSVLGMLKIDQTVQWPDASVRTRRVRQEAR